MVDHKLVTIDTKIQRYKDRKLPKFGSVKMKRTKIMMIAYSVVVSSIRSTGY